MKPEFLLTPFSFIGVIFFRSNLKNYVFLQIKLDKEDSE